jgi:hypothetical protein
MLSFLANTMEAGGVFSRENVHDRTHLPLRTANFKLEVTYEELCKTIRESSVCLSWHYCAVTSREAKYRGHKRAIDW